MSQPATSNQATDLMDWLTKQREHVLGILENLPEGRCAPRCRLPRPVSTWTTCGRSCCR
jgi:hypothetical protein